MALLTKPVLYYGRKSEHNYYRAMDKRLYPIDKTKFEQEIEPKIREQYKRIGRPVAISHYEFFCASLYVLRTGISWRDLPRCYGKWHTVYMRFRRWSLNGILWNLLYSLQQLKKATVDVVFVDSSAVPLHRHGSGALKKTVSKL